MTELIRAENQNTVYLVEQNEKRVIRSREELSSLGYSMTQVSDVPLGFVNSIPLK